jgi:hypothetical protein
MSRKLLFFVLAFALCSLYGVAGSQDDFRIARLSYLEGDVSFQHNVWWRTDQVDWTAASINLPLQPGDRIYTGDNGRAEIEFDDGSVLRLAEKTDVEIFTMKQQLIQLRVLVGLCSLMNRSSVAFEINTPAAAFTTTQKGSYRFDIAENGDSDGIVRKGELEAVNNRFSRQVKSGEVLHVPAADNASEVLSQYDQRDAWDEWNDRRNADATAYESRAYVGDQVNYGVGDLDRYGHWVNVGAYGPAWVPTVSTGWSPYWEGRWIYRPYWGWTWVSYDPWGWLPYHYGRWYHSGLVGWCWIPGPYFGFNFWSPGLVRFYMGSDWISWCALGPGDYYNVNNYFFNGSNRTNIYYLNELRLMQRRGPDQLINQTTPGAFRTVRTGQFVNGSLGGRVEQIRGAQDPWRGGRIVTGSLDVRPTARSYAPAPERASVRSTARERAVVIRSEPEVNSRADKFVRITNPRIAVSRAGAGQPANVGGGQPARNVTVVPNTSSRRAQDIPDRNTSSSGRTYQVPPAGTVTNGQGNAQRTPERQGSIPRAQQPPTAGRTTTDTSGRRIEVAPPTYNPPSSWQSSSGQVAPPSLPSSSSSGRAAPPSPPPSSASPPATASPVKKRPSQQLSSNYAAREYQQPQGRVTQAPATVRQLPAQSSTRSQSPASARSYGSYTSRSSTRVASGSFAVRGTSPASAPGGRLASSQKRVR